MARRSVLHMAFVAITRQSRSMAEHHSNGCIRGTFKHPSNVTRELSFRMQIPLPDLFFLERNSQAARCTFMWPIGH